MANVVSPLFATATPTPNAIPISDGSGTLNDWVDVSPCVPITVGSGVEFEVGANCQTLFSYPITINGLAVIDGLLIEVN